MNLKPHDQIPISNLLNRQLHLRCVNLREEGLSYAEIAKELAVSKSFAIKKIREYGGPKNIDVPCTSGASPYGYVRVRGKLFMDPREMGVISKILKYYEMGFSSYLIAVTLNRKKIRPRRAFAWDHSSVRKIIEKNAGKLAEIEKFLSSSI